MNRQITLSLLIFCLFSTLFSCDPSIQLKFTPYWLKMTAFPVRREGAIAFTVGGNLYAGLGLGENEAGDIYMYQQTSKQWKRVADFPGGIRRNAAHFVIDDIAYVGTGYNGGSSDTSIKSDFYAYDYKKDAWTRIADFPGHARTLTTSFSLEGEGYVGLGAYSPSAPSFSDFYVYNKNTNTWRKVADLPGEGRSFSVSFVANNIAYVGLGEDLISQKVYPDFYAYDHASNTWTQVDSFPQNYLRGAIGVGLSNGKGIAGLGILSNGKRSPLFYTYDATSRKWDTATITYPSSYGGLMDAAICNIDNSVYVGLGGADTSIVASNKLIKQLNILDGLKGRQSVLSNEFYTFYYAQ